MGGRKLDWPMMLSNLLSDLSGRDTKLEAKSWKHNNFQQSVSPILGESWVPVDFTCTVITQTADSFMRLDGSASMRTSYTIYLHYTMN